MSSVLPSAFSSGGGVIIGGSDLGGGGFTVSRGVIITDATVTRGGIVEIWQPADTVGNMGYDYVIVDPSSGTPTGGQTTFKYDDGSTMTVTESFSTKSGTDGTKWIKVDQEFTTYHSTPATDVVGTTTTFTGTGDVDPGSGSLPAGFSYMNGNDTDWDDWGRLDEDGG